MALPAFLFPLLAKGMAYKWWILGGLALSATIGGYILALKLEIGGLNKDLLQETRQNAVLRESMVRDAATIKNLADRLESCNRKNRVIEEGSRRAVEELERQVEDLRSTSAEDKEKVKEALEDEECASTNLPSDVERVLREGAARANGDTGSTR